MNAYNEMITSRDNPSVKHFRKLLDSKKERLAERAFILEGKRLVLDAFYSDADIEKVFVTCTALGRFGSELSDIMAKCSVTVISDEIGNHISDTENTQGVFAKCRFPENMDVMPELKKCGRYVVLSKLRDPGNAGMIIRTADALGLDGVIFSESCDIYNPKTVRATMGALFRVPVYHNIEINDIFEKLEQSGLHSLAAVVDKDAADIRKCDLSEGAAVFIGNEANGLDDDVKERCTQRITIKMSGNAESLNAAMASGILMWELVR